MKSSIRYSEEVRDEQFGWSHTPTMGLSGPRPVEYG